MIKALYAYLKALMRGQIVAAADPFPFITPGSLVFDVGANIGNYSARFLRMGARVIALEPQPFCKQYLRLRFMFNKQLTIVGNGVSDHEGKAELMLTGSHTIASIDKEWIEGVSESKRFNLESKDWDKKTTIELTTLDRLVREFGKPQFIKIDVEGHEDKVMRGLSVPIDYVTFEYTLPEHMGSCLRCIEHLASIGNYEFESVEQAGQWKNAQVFSEEIKKISASGELLNGDILARRK